MSCKRISSKCRLPSLPGHISWNNGKRVTPPSLSPESDEAKHDFVCEPQQQSEAAHDKPINTEATFAPPLIPYA